MMLAKLLDNSYLVFCLLGFLFFILLKLRRSMLNRNGHSNILIGKSQIKGQRNEQEDSYATTANANGILAVLADGMGGYEDGKKASGIVIDTFIEAFNNADITNIADFFHQTSFACNKKVLALGKSGSTLAGVIIEKGFLNWISVGDSAIILFRNGEISNLNKKHIFKSMLEEQYQSGKISKAEVLHNPKKNHLTSYFGYEGLRDIELNTKSLKLLYGDKVLLCSDGVYNSLTELELENLLALKLKPEKLVEKVMDCISEKDIPNQDNATILILEFNNRMF